MKRAFGKTWRLMFRRKPLLHASESGAAAVARPVAMSLAALLTGHVLRDGEVVLLVLKPSRWLILFNCVPVAAAALLMLLSLRFFHPQMHPKWVRFCIGAAIFIVAGRVMWAICQWMGRLYVLTDQRILRLSGVFNVNLYDLPLRKVSRTQVLRSFKERVCRAGSIVIHPRDESSPPGLWQTIRRPLEVNEAIVAAIHRAGPGDH
jgi:hypothetical protein